MRKKIKDEELKQAIKNETILQQSRINYNRNIFIPPIIERPSNEIYETIQQQQDFFRRNLANIGMKYNVIDAILPMLNDQEINMINTFWGSIKKSLESKFNIKLLTPDIFVPFVNAFFGNEIENISKGNQIYTDYKTGANKQIENNNENYENNINENYDNNNEKALIKKITSTEN